MCFEQKILCGCSLGKYTQMLTIENQDVRTTQVVSTQQRPKRLTHKIADGVYKCKQQGRI